jgi:hypothetical protein
VRFVVDAQLPPALVHFLISAGHQADHVADVGLAAAPDSEMWRYAQERGATIITKDEDFLSLRAFRWTCDCLGSPRQYDEEYPAAGDDSGVASDRCGPRIRRTGG